MGEREHWEFEDPAEAKGTEEEKLTRFRLVRDQIRERVKSRVDSSQSA